MSKKTNVTVISISIAGLMSAIAIVGPFVTWTLAAGEKKGEISSNTSGLAKLERVHKGDVDGIIEDVSCIEKAQIRIAVKLETVEKQLEEVKKDQKDHFAKLMEAIAKVKK